MSPFFLLLLPSPLAHPLSLSFSPFESFSHTTSFPLFHSSSPSRTHNMSFLFLLLLPLILSFSLFLLFSQICRRSYLHRVTRRRNEHRRCRRGTCRILYTTDSRHSLYNSQYNTHARTWCHIHATQHTVYTKYKLHHTQFPPQSRSIPHEKCYTQLHMLILTTTPTVWFIHWTLSFDDKLPLCSLHIHAYLILNLFSW